MYAVSRRSVEQRRGGPWKSKRGAPVQGHGRGVTSPLRSEISHMITDILYLCQSINTSLCVKW